MRLADHVLPWKRINLKGALYEEGQGDGDGTVCLHGPANDGSDGASQQWLTIASHAHGLSAPLLCLVWQCVVHCFAYCYVKSATDTSLQFRG